jgi:hypothetical protein
MKIILIEFINLMDRRYKAILIQFFLIISISLSAQKFNADIIYDAYINNKYNVWKDVCDEMQKNKNKSNDFLFSLINIEYGYIAHCISTSNNIEALKHLDFTEKKLQEIELTYNHPSLIKSYKSALLSFRASLDNKTAIKSALKGLEFADKSIKEDSTNYFGFLQRGNIYRYSPSAFNGSKHKAILHYLKAESLLKKEISSKKNWNYMDLLVTITNTYIEIKDLKGATEYRDKILKIEPNFIFAKVTLTEKIEKLKIIKNKN